MNKIFRAKRTRAKIHGTAERPRLSVHFSNQHITAQIIDDDKKMTLAYATTVGAKMTKLYAGRMSALADAARKEGLEF